MEDMGGFSDGLMLVVQVFTTFYSANAFAAEFLNKKFVDGADDTTQEQILKSPAFDKALHRMNTNIPHENQNLSPVKQITKLLTI